MGGSPNPLLRLFDALRQRRTYSTAHLQLRSATVLIIKGERNTPPRIHAPGARLRRTFSINDLAELRDDKVMGSVVKANHDTILEYVWRGF